MARTTLVLGGARSGKSRHAQARAEAIGDSLTFLATGQPYDDDMTDRIARHQADRDERWRTVEAPLALADALRLQDAAGRVMLVDCLTLWLSNHLLAGNDLEHETGQLLATLAATRARVILVSNEVGFGIVPDNALARRFRDAVGRLHQRLALLCDEVELVVAGLPLRLKPAA